MAATVITALATQAVEALAQQVSARATELIKGSLGFKDHLEIIKRKFENIQAILEDISKLEDSHKSEQLKYWVQRVKDVAYDADDVMDDYEFEILRRKMELKDGFDKLRNFFMSSNPFVFNFRMSRKVQKILSLFKKLEEEAKAYDLRILTQETMPYDYVDNLLSETREYAAANPSEFVGRVDVIEELLEKIFDPSIEQHRISTIAIIGMGGIGKTTLARSLYNHVKISDHFSEKMWIYVSQKFSIKRVLNDMIESLTLSKPDLSTEDAITRSLQQNLEGKKFLLVLDDAWNTNPESWDSLSESLHRIGGLPGSVILITTRENEVAEAARALFRHNLKQLSKEESWSLFLRKVSSNGTSINQSKEEIGRRIVEKCSGIPLAIKVIGGLLKPKQHPHEWESIEKSKLWDLPQGRNQILPSLMLSFSHLPTPSLKQCFAYMSIFPKNEYLHKSKLVGVWSSQGFLGPYNRSNRSSVELGEDYVKMLLNCSLLQEERKGRYVYMHDLVHDLAVYVFKDGLMTKEPTNLQAEGCGRHLVINPGEDRTASDFPAREVLLKLRTIGLTGNQLGWSDGLPSNVPWDKLIQARYLHTLFLDRNNITELPSEIGSLKHLRYFDLSNNPIKTLPNSFGKLYQLETLGLDRCRKLEMLPNVLYRLVNLRFICTEDRMYACKGLKELIHLEALPRLALKADGEGWTIDELGKLDQLRGEINIDGLEHVKDEEEARKAGLAGKPKVTTLILCWTDEREVSEGVSDEGILNGLEPHPNITTLGLGYFYGEKFPSWVMAMAALSSNLTAVHFVGCLRCRSLPSLGQLPNLEKLTLDGLDVGCIGKEFYGGEGFLAATMVSFPCLRKLWIYNFKRLTTWMDPPQEAFTGLEFLKVQECWLLESVPASLFSPRMKKIEFLDCPSLRKFPSSVEECSYLESLKIDNSPIIESPPINFSKLERLKVLSVCYSAKDMRSMLDSIQHLPNLISLGIGGYKNEEEMRDYFSDITLYNSLQSLTELTITGCPNIKTLPGELGLLSRIEYLCLRRFPDLEEIPDWLCSLSSLKTLVAEECKKSIKHSFNGQFTRQQG